MRAGMGIAIGYAQNGLTPRVDREVERGLFEVTTAVRLDAFDADAFADDMERASRGTDSAIELVQGAMNLLAGRGRAARGHRRGHGDPPAAAGRAAGGDRAQRLGVAARPGICGTRPTWPGRCAAAGCGSCTG